MKVDIVKNEMYIERLVRVIEGFITPKTIPMKEKGRVGDGFIFVLEGSCHYTFDDGISFWAQKGDILYLANEAVYQMVIENETYKFVYCDFLFSESQNRQSATYHMKNATKINHLFYQLMNTYRQTGAGKTADCMAILYKIYSELLQNEQHCYVASPSRQKMEAAEKYICAHFKDDELSVKKLAAEAQMSEVHFRNLFYSCYHVTPSRYIMNVRLENAKALMQYNFFTLEEIALQSGFSSVPYFCKVFKAATNMTPSAYRKRVIS